MTYSSTLANYYHEPTYFIIDTVIISASFSPLHRSGNYTGGSNEWITFSEAEAKQLGSGEKGDYYSLLGVLTFTFADNAVYKACPQEQCNKKLVDQENGLFRCEKCNREYPNYKYRILLGVSGFCCFCSYTY